MTLNLTPLEKSLRLLRQGIDVVESAMQDPEVDPLHVDFMRAGVMLYFRMTYDWGWKAVDDWAKAGIAVESSRQPKNKKELFRIAFEDGVVTDAQRWMNYGEVRNLTTQLLYDDSRCYTVFEEAKRLLTDAQCMFCSLRRCHLKKTDPESA